MYLKNMDNWKLKDLACLDDGEIEELYNRAKKKLARFVSMEIEVVVERSKRPGHLLQKEVTKKSKADDVFG